MLNLRECIPNWWKCNRDEVCIIPIHCCYAEQIYLRTKRVEYRKTIPRNGINIFFIYETSPVSAISGVFLLEKCISGAVLDIWHVSKFFAGIKENDYFDYYNGKESAVGLQIKDVFKFTSKIRLDSLNMRPPQSMVYKKL